MDFPRLSQKEYLILNMLRSGAEYFGLEMVNESNGALKRGTVYVTLGRMAEKGYVHSQQEKIIGKSGMPKRKYRISGEGKLILQAAEAAAEIWEGIQHV